MTVQYADIPLSFKPHPITGDIGRLTEEAAVKQAIKLIVLTNRFERVKAPSIGGNLLAHLFDLASPANALMLKSSIELCLQNSEVRAVVKNVEVIPDHDNNTYNVAVVFQTQQMLEPEVVTINLERVR